MENKSALNKWTNPPQESQLVPVDSLALPDSRDLIRAVAMDIGKEVAHHIETMYPDAVKAASSTFLLSVRNFTHNQIIAAIESEQDVDTRLAFRAKFRRYIRAQYRKIRSQK